MVKHVAIVSTPFAFSTLDVFVGYSHAFKRLGIETTEVKLHEMWQFWFDTFGLSAPLNPDEQARILKRATGDAIFATLEAKPDLVIVIDGTSIHELFWDWMLRLSIPTATVMTDCPYSDQANVYAASRSTYAFANDKLSAETMGLPYLPMAYSHEIHRPRVVSNRYQSDIVFVGSGFPERVEFLEQVNWDGIDFRLLGYWELPSGHPLEPFFNQKKVVMPNPEVANYYCGAKLVLNLDRVSVDFHGHNRIVGRGSVGPRIYEAAACGAAIISQDTVPELGELLGEAYLPFDTPQQLEILLMNWLRGDRGAERREMGTIALQKIAPHSYMDRAQELLEAIDI